MTTGAKTIKQKLFFSAMIIAFMWVIAGDLVSIHLNVIFGKNTDSSWHHPYAKTHKDDNTYKVKKLKSNASSKVKHLCFITPQVSSIQLASSNYLYLQLDHHTLHFREGESSLLRGPPSLS